MRKIPQTVKTVVSDVFAPPLFFSCLERETFKFSFLILLRWE